MKGFCEVKTTENLYRTKNKKYQPKKDPERPFWGKRRERQEGGFVGGKRGGKSRVN